MTELFERVVEYFARMLFLIIVLLATLVLIFAATSVGAAECLSKKEARSKWPRAHLYWNTGERCWDRRRWTYAKKQRHKSQLALAASSDKKPKEEKEQRDYCCWPKLPRDQAGNVIEPPPSFGERWDQVRDAFRSVWRRLTE